MLSFLTKTKLALLMSFLVVSVSFADTYPSGLVRDGAFVQLYCFDEGKRPLVMETITSYIDALDDSLSPERQSNYATYFSRSSLDYKVDPFMLVAVAVQRSRLDWTYNTGGCYGLMAVDWDSNKRWITQDHPRVTSRRVLCKPVINVRVGADLMLRELRKSSMDYGSMLSGPYSFGPGAIETILGHYRNMARIFRSLVEEGRS